MAVWDISKEKPVKKWGGAPVQTLSFSPDGNSLVLGDYNGEGNLTIKDAETGKIVRREWTLPYSVRKAEFAPDGRHVVALLANRVIYILRLA